MKFIKEYKSFNISSDLLLDIKQIFLEVQDMGFKIIVNSPTHTGVLNIVIFYEHHDIKEFKFDIIRECILRVCSITGLKPTIYHGEEDDCPVPIEGECSSIISIDIDSILIGHQHYIEIDFE